MPETNRIIFFDPTSAAMEKSAHDVNGIEIELNLYEVVDLRDSGFDLLEV